MGSGSSIFSLLISRIWLVYILEHHGIFVERRKGGWEGGKEERKEGKKRKGRKGGREEKIYRNKTKLIK